MTLEVVEATTSAELADVERLLCEYWEALAMDPAFQEFGSEVATLPGAYAPPAGRLLLARSDGEPIGCVALRPLEADVCEMKRLYVRPAGRGTGVGRLLGETIIQAARSLGYRTMRLDTLRTMVPAFELYRSLGFVEIEPYTANPLPGVRFLELTLVA